jgi:Na+/proline symporter
MEKSVKEKVPNVVALIAGLLGMVLMTVWCYIIDPEPSPRDVAVKAGIAWGVMLIVGYIVGSIGTRFLPEPAVKKRPEDEAAAGPAGAAKISIGATGGANASAAAATPSDTGSLDENAALNILLNEPHDLVGAQGGSGATTQVPRHNLQKLEPPEG